MLIALFDSILLLTPEPKTKNSRTKIHAAITINFHSTPNSEKSNDKIFRETQKTLFFDHFRPILPILGKKSIFTKNWVQRNKQ